MKHIAIFQSDLLVGGIQKSLINILNDIDYSRYEVDLFLFDSECFFDMPEHDNLNIHILKPYPAFTKLVYFGLLRRFRPVVRNDKHYDVSIDFNSYRSDCAVGALGVKADRYVMLIHNDVEIKLKNEPKYRILWHFFKGKLRRYDMFAAVSPGIIEGFRRTTGIRDKEIVTLPNHIDTAEIFRKRGMPVDFRVDNACFNICTMGRICHQKGFDLLVGYMAEVVRRRPEARLYIIGDGPDREKLLAQIGSLGLSDKITLLGNQPNPFPYMQQMDAFVLTSRYEGQGMVILEAKALGLPLYISRNLEAYNPGIRGYDDIAGALIAARRQEKQPDDLAAYNAGIRRTLERILDTGAGPTQKNGDEA